MNEDDLIGFTVYPVPPTNRIVNENNTPVVQYHILNFEGKVLRTIGNPGLTTEVDISILDRGICLIRAKTERPVAAIRYVK